MDTPTFNILSLCSGIGGIELGLKLAIAESRTICYCEREAHSIKVLVKRIEEGILDDAPIWDDLVTFDGKPWHNKVDCLTAGFPCQPFSSIGRKLGKEDAKWIWPSIARIVGEVEPEWCFFENVPALLRMGFEQVHDDLQSMGYKVAAGVFTAEEVGAGHRRERLFLLAHSIGRGWRRQTEGEDADVDKPEGEAKGEEPQSRGSSHASDNGSSVMEDVGEKREVELGFPPRPDSEAWDRIETRLPVESCVLGMVDGLTTKMDRLRGCGNAVIPAMAGFAFRTLEQTFKC